MRSLPIPTSNQTVSSEYTHTHTWWMVGCHWVRNLMFVCSLTAAPQCNSRQVQLAFHNRLQICVQSQHTNPAIDGGGGRHAHQLCHPPPPPADTACSLGQQERGKGWGLESHRTPAARQSYTACCSPNRMTLRLFDHSAAPNQPSAAAAADRSPRAASSSAGASGQGQR